MMKKALVAASLAIGSAFAAAPAAYADVVGFTDGFAPGNWKMRLTGTPPGGGAPPAGATNDGSTLTLSGGDSGTPDLTPFCTAGPCMITYTIVTPGPDHHLLFHWDYNSFDADGPNFDVFGFLINGAPTQLSANSGPAHQFGDEVVSLDIGSTFGWFIDCTDCVGGNAVAVITNFEAAPEPGSLALLALGLAGIAGLRRSRVA